MNIFPSLNQHPINLSQQVKMNRAFDQRESSQLPICIRKSEKEIIDAAKGRFFRKKEKCRKHRLNPKNDTFDSPYQEAKKAETIQRDLEKALFLYGVSAQEGQKIDSCIKDFASVLHQLGYTKNAVNFLEKLRNFYDGDLKKYDRLIATLEKQLKPSGKHDCKAILIELPTKEKATPELIASMFQNTSRVKISKIFNHLALNQQSESEGKWLVLYFESFSAAKKTLEKFKFDEWFGLNKYWLKNDLITCEAHDGREDFENNLVVSTDMIEQHLMKCWPYEAMFLWNQSQALHYYNQSALMLIEDDLAAMSVDVIEQKQQGHELQFITKLSIH